MKRLYVVALLIAGILAAACGSNTSSTGASTNTTQSGGDSTPIVIGFGAPVVEQLIPEFAKAQGIFKKHGLTNVTVQQITSASAVIPGMRSGAITFDVMASPQPEEGAASGVDLKWLAMWDSRPDLQIIAAPGIKSAGNLRGKVVGMSSTGSTTGVLTIAYLASQGIASTNVRLVPLASVTAQAQAFVSGQLAAFASGPPLTQSVLAKRPGSTILAQLSQTMKWNGAGLVGYSPWVQAHIGTTAKVVAAIKDAVSQWKSSPAAAEQTIASAGKVPVSVAKATYQATLGLISTSITPSASLEASVLQVLGTQLPNTKAIKAVNLIDTQFTH